MNLQLSDRIFKGEPNDSDQWEVIFKHLIKLKIEGEIEAPQNANSNNYCKAYNVENNVKIYDPKNTEERW